MIMQGDFMETGFDVFPAVPGHRPPSTTVGVCRFFDDPDSGGNAFMYHSFMFLFGALEAGPASLGIDPLGASARSGRILSLGEQF